MPAWPKRNSQDPVLWGTWKLELSVRQLVSAGWIVTPQVKICCLGLPWPHSMKGWSPEKNPFVIQGAFLWSSVPSKDMSHPPFPPEESFPGPFALLVLSVSSDVRTAVTEKGKVNPQN